MEKNKLILSLESNKIVSKALDNSNDFTYTKDFVLTYIDNPDDNLKLAFEKFEIDIANLKNKLISAKILDVKNREYPNYSRKLYKAIKTSDRETTHLNKKEITSYIILLCILRDESDKTTKILNDFDINYDKMSSLYLKISN